MLDFKTELSQESDYPLSDELFNMIMSEAHKKEYDKGELIISAGAIVPDIFIIQDGVVMGYLNVQGVEKILYFGLCGTLLTSMHSFSCHKPSVMNIEACSKVTVLCIPKYRFNSLMNTSIEFCRWIAGVFSRRCYFQEVKSNIMSGDSKWRYKWLKKCRPELIQNVLQKHIASYLGITEVHLSRIRKNLQ